MGAKFSGVGAKNASKKSKKAGLKPFFKPALYQHRNGGGSKPAPVKVKTTRDDSCDGLLLAGTFFLAF